MRNLTIKKGEILFSRPGELIRITSPADNAIRFQSFPGGRIIDEDYTLIPGSTEVIVEENEGEVGFICKSLKLVLEQDGKATFFRDNMKILEEKNNYTFGGNYRIFENKGADMWSASVTFLPDESEHFYGLGHSWDNEFDLKGCSVELRNINAKCVIPYVYSSLGYGFLWNNPSIGVCELSRNKTLWKSECCRFMDYVVIGGSPKEVCSTLADLTGHAPEMPEWATGFWQSRLRYETEDELLEVAQRYREEKIPLSAIIVDYFHWTEQGDYRFDPRYWHDVKAMSRELHDMNTKLVVSVWPTVSEDSENYRHMRENNMLMLTARGSDKVFPFYGWQAEIDVTNPQTREFVWSKIKENYIDNGVDALWFDVAEPEISPSHFDNLIWNKGRGDMVALLYPYYYSKLAYDGFRAMGRNDIVTLIRCAYTGSQKFGSLVWSGDIASTFESLRHQICGALNMSMCGIPWWNTDIGGFYGADITSDYFKELIVRWFQFGLFSPVMRLHGSRVHHGERTAGIKEPSGDPNELWSFGEDVFRTLKELVMLRERLRPYIKKQMHIASVKGYPVIRPMFFEYPQDSVCYGIGDQYLFGDDILFAPIFQQGQTERTVYLPDDNWILTKNKTKYNKGWHTVKAKTHEFIAFCREGSDVLRCFFK